MQLNSDSIFEAALRLPESERLTLVSKLMETMPDENLTLSVEDSELIAKLDRRFGQTEGTITWLDLKAEG